MKISIDGTCRGNGKIYTRFLVRGLDPNHTLNIHGRETPNGSSPCSIYESLNSKRSPSVRQFVGVFPIIEAWVNNFTITEIDDAGRVIESQAFRLNYEIAKWQSRINYRINKPMCSEIRDYDQIAAYDRADMEFWSCVEDGEEMIIRGAVYTPYRDDTSLTITCKDSRLSPINIEIVPLGTAKLKTKFSAERARRESQFSIRLPHAMRRHIFQIEDANHPSFSNFAVLDIPELQNMIEHDRYLRENAQIDHNYPKWFDSHKATLGALSKQRDITFTIQPFFSIVVPLFNTPIDLFHEMVSSVLSQTYRKWELVLVNASPKDNELADAIASVLAIDSRILEIRLEDNLGISENTNAGIAVAHGDFICFFDHDDVIEPNLLFSYAEAINSYNDIDLLYCDEDKLMPDGTFAQPFFKPDFDLELLRNNNYICHMLAIRKSLLDQLEGNTKEFDGAQDHNLTLQAVEKARRVFHVTSILYHWRISATSTAANADSKPYASAAGIRAVQSHLNRMGIKANVELSRRPFTYKVTYQIPEEHPLVSIIIPTKDQIDILDTCIQSILKKTTYDNYEIVLVENNSTEEETFEYYGSILKKYPERIKFITWDNEFNFSKLVNFGAQSANGDYLLLLNNDTEIITPKWIEAMLGICSQPDVGIVGAKLYYPDETIQHAGVTISGGVAGHLGRHLPRNDWGYFALLDAQRELSAVTAACMLTKRSIFESVGGFTEKLQVAFNDVDYCLKVREQGQRVIFTPEVELYHYESISRGADNISMERQVRFHKEVAYMNYRWAPYYVEGDPYSNPNFSRLEPNNLYFKLS